MDRKSTSSDEPLPLYSEHDDGRINIDVNSGLFRTLSLLVPDPERDSKCPPPQRHGSATVASASGLPSYPAYDGYPNIDPDYKPAAASAAAPAPAYDSDSDAQGPPPAYQYRAGKSLGLRLNIVLQVVGSRGDVQPFVALGVELQRRHGHRVRVATHDVFRAFVQEAGLEFFPIGGDPAELMAYMVKNPGLLPSMSSLRAGDLSKKRRMMAAILDGCWRSCLAPDPDDVDHAGPGSRGRLWPRPFTADAIIANPPSFAHVHCAQALGIPVHLMFTMPWSSTRAFAHPLVNMRITGSRVSARQANYMSYYAVEWMTWQGLGDLVNTWRESLDLEPIPASEGPTLVKKLQVPVTYCWSPTLVPKPADWPSYIDVCGFFFRETPAYTPDPRLHDFLQDGPPPVYIGFGSIVVDDPAQLTRILVDAVLQTGCRAIISAGWSKLGAADASGATQPGSNIFWLGGDCPHEWLFQHVAAVVHHGGAGTTACGLKNGRPTTIVPFFGDQPFWGAMVAHAGAGPNPIPHRELNSTNLAAAIRFCLQASTAAAAAAVAAQMTTEFGVQQAVESFHAHLPVDRMRCDVLPDRAAAWIFKGKRKRDKDRADRADRADRPVSAGASDVSVNRSVDSLGHADGEARSDTPDNPDSKARPVKLSSMAANALVENGQLAWCDLSRYRPQPFVVEVERWEPVSALSSSFLGTTLDLTASFKDIVVPIQSYNRLKKRRQDMERAMAESAAGSAAGSASGSASASVGATGSADGTHATNTTHELDDGGISLRGGSSEFDFSTDGQVSSTASSRPPSVAPAGPAGPAGSAPPSVAPPTEGTSPNSLNKELALAVCDSASGVGSFLASFYKGFVLDLPLAVTEGFRSAPRLYGEDVPAHKPITDWRSGMDVAGDNFYHGVYRGLTGLVREPVEGAEKDGVVGAVKGAGRGLGNMVTGVPSGFLGLVAYSGQGLYQTTRNAVRRTTRRHIEEARRTEAQTLSADDDMEIVRRFAQLSQMQVSYAG